MLVVAELAVPVWAERGFQTAWHPGHIAERYGLFTIIVLGESVLSATTAVQIGLDSGEQITDLIVIAGAGLVILFSMWWVYFDQPAARFLVSSRMSFVWGYGHYLIFAAAAAVGAGLAVASDEATHHAYISETAAEAAAVVPVAVFLASVWVL
nr:low temperature requirement protein A [Micromonospora sp. DSM 115978]